MIFLPTTSATPSATSIQELLAQRLFTAGLVLAAEPYNLRNRLFQGMIGSTTSDASHAGWTRAFVFRALKYESGWTRSLASCQALEMPSERSWPLRFWWKGSAAG